MAQELHELESVSVNELDKAVATPAVVRLLKQLHEELFVEAKEVAEGLDLG